MSWASWEEIKQAIELYTGLSRDALHIHAAVLLQLLVAAVSRLGLRHPIPWLVVFVLEILNERTDMMADGVSEKWEQSAAIHDLWNTMLIPTLLFLISRYTPALLWHGASFETSLPDGGKPK